MDAAGVVLAGGRSSRMGRAKAALDWHGSTLLHRTTALLARTVGGPVVVVRAAAQELPGLPAGVRVVEDPLPGLGPLQGIAAGLAAVEPDAAAAFVCSTDLPFLHPAFVRRVLDGLGDHDVALPVARGFRQPLAAAYRTGLAARIATLLAAGRRRPGMLFEECDVAELDEAALLADPELARLDPGLESVTNASEPGDYAAAAARPAPTVTIECFGPLALDGRRGPRGFAAATLAEAAAAAGIVLDRLVVATVNGDRMSRDAALPLVAGDTVAFLAADAGG
jgi:molybdenum cofactor guanylyltransferase